MHLGNVTASGTGRGESACLSYKLSISCGGKMRISDVRASCGELSLAPSCVFDYGGMYCEPSDEIILSPCKDFSVTEHCTEIGGCREIKCVCLFRQCVESRLKAEDFCRLISCRISGEGIRYCGGALVARYTVCIIYEDKSCRKKRAFLHGSVLFCEVPQDFTEKNFTLHFTEPICRTDCSGELTVCFAAELCLEAD